MSWPITGVGPRRRGSAPEPPLALPARDPGGPVRQAAVVTTDAPARRTLAGSRLPSAESAALRDRFPPRPAEAAWDLTGQSRAAVLERCGPPFALDNASSQNYRKFGLTRILDWLAAQPGGTWQDRWNASGAGIDGRADWRPPVVQWLLDTGRIAAGNSAPRDLSASA